MKKIFAFAILFLCLIQVVVFAFPTGVAFFRSSPAILHKNSENVTGMLWLTRDSLVFEPSGFNFQNGVITIPLKKIASISKCWSKYLIIPIYPNSMSIKTSDGYSYRFLVDGRSDWMESINKARLQ